MHAFMDRTTDLLQHGLARSISREQMAELPIRRYDGPVVLVQTERELQDARADAAEETIVGLDTETRPSFSKGESYLPCLVQVATARAVYLYRFRELDVSPALTELLEDARIVKVGVSLAEDLRGLKQVFAFEEKNTLDLGLVARRCGFSQTGVRNLAGIFLGFRVPKGARTSNWAASRLTPQQITYAATDAWICRELYLRYQAIGVINAGHSGEGQNPP
jgi:ribonuclease D